MVEGLEPQPRQAHEAVEPRTRQQLQRLVDQGRACLGDPGALDLQPEQREASYGTVNRDDYEAVLYLARLGRRSGRWRRHRDQGSAPPRGTAACEGQRIGYPGELAEATESMCGLHQTAAMDVVDARRRRTQRSNPAVCRVLQAAVTGLEAPHLPDHLREP